MLIKIFHDPKLNKNNAQLIFTTHDASLLARELGKYLFRRDQIWLTDKNKDGSTKLYSLAEYEIPEDEVHTDRSYLSGIYGALPFIDMSLLSKISSKKKPTKRASGKGTRK
jgi:AAA15 family ATPase/GTPase